MEKVFYLVKVKFLNLANQTLIREVDLSEMDINDKDTAKEEAEKVVKTYYRIPSKNIISAEITIKRK